VQLQANIQYSYAFKTTGPQRLRSKRNEVPIAEIELDNGHRPYVGPYTLSHKQCTLFVSAITLQKL